MDRNPDWLPDGLVTAGLIVYWLIMAVRAILARAVPWYYKIYTPLTLPVFLAGLSFPKYEVPLFIAAIVLIVVGFVTDALWARTDLLGDRSDLMKKPGKPRHLRTGKGRAPKQRQDDGGRR